MRSEPLNLLGGSNVDSNRAWSTEDTINYFLEKASSDGFLTPLEFREAPGLKPFVLGPLVDGFPAGPVRGAHDCEGKHFTVMGNRLYQITPTRIAIPLGTVPGTQRVNMAHNQIPGGNEVIVTTGTPNGYVYNTVTEVFGRITDAGYPGGGSVDYIDTYLVSVEPLGRYWFWSDQASATSYNTLNRTEAEADPDSIVALAVNSFEVVVFGQQTVEFFYNAGGINGSTFRSKKVMNNHGCAARDSVVKLDNSLFWLGVDGIIYRLNGYQAQPVSSPQFTQRIQGKNWAKAFAYAFDDLGHAAYVITFPDGETFVYDVPVSATTRLQSYGLNRWRASTLIKTGGRWIAGDFQAGKLYELDWAYPMEGEGTPMVRERISGNVANARNKIEVPLLELLFQTGAPQVEPVEFVAQPEGPTVSGALPDGSVGLSWAGGTYAATGGTPPYTFTSRPGSTFPGDLGPMSAAGVVSPEVPNAIGTGVNIVRATDANGLYDELTDTFQIGNTIGLLGTSNVSFRNFLLFGPGGTDWDNAYQYSGLSPELPGIGLLAGDGHWVTWLGGAVSSPVYSTDATGTAWVTSGDSFESATKLAFGCYEPTVKVFLIPSNSGVYWSDDHCINITKTTTIPCYAVAASSTLALGASLFDSEVLVAPSPFTVWTQGGVHNVRFNSGGYVEYGGGRFLICGGGETGDPDQGFPKAVFTADGVTFDPQTLPGFAAGYIKAAAYDEANGIWVIGTDAGEFAYMNESDGIWLLSPDTIGTSQSVKSIKHNGVIFVACGLQVSTGSIKTSPDGQTWTSASTMESIGPQLLAVMK